MDGLELDQLPMPVDILKLILKILNPELLFRLALSSTKLWKITLYNAEGLSFGPPPSGYGLASRLRSEATLLRLVCPLLTRSFPRWTTRLNTDPNLLGNVQVLRLEAAVGPEIVARLVHASPRLRKLSCIPWAPGQPPLVSGPQNPLCQALRAHPALQSFLIEDKIHPNLLGLFPFLPPQLTELSIHNLDFTMPEKMFSDIATACPSLTSLTIFRRGSSATITTPHSAFEHLKQLPKLQTLRIPTIEGITAGSFDPQQSRRTIDKLDELLPKNEWKDLQISNIRGYALLAPVANDIPLLRRVLARFGLHPSIMSLNAPDLGICKLTDEEQLNFVRFLTEDCGLSFTACQCDHTRLCLECCWANHIPRMQPRAAAYLIERHFFALVAKQARINNSTDLNSEASRLLDNFKKTDQVEETVLNYIRNYNYPLAPAFRSAKWPKFPHAFFTLKFASGRAALVTRAAETNTPLGLEQRMTYNELREAEPSVLVEAATLEPLFFLRNLDILIQRVHQDELVRLAKAWQMEEAATLAELVAADIFNHNHPERLFQVLSNILSPQGFQKLVDDMILKSEVSDDAWRWLESGGYTTGRHRQFRVKAGRKCSDSDPQYD